MMTLQHLLILLKKRALAIFGNYYAQSKFDITNDLTLYAGINSMYSLLNKNFSFDPRASVRWELNPRHSISFGFGKHSQLEELKIYLVNKNENGKIEIAQ